MSIFNRFKEKAIFERKTEELLYGAVAEEMATGARNEALWLKAMEGADGQEGKFISEYIKLRIQSLKDDVHIMKEIGIVIDATDNGKTGLKRITLVSSDVVDVDVDVDVDVAADVADVADVERNTVPEITGFGFFIFAIMFCAAVIVILT